MPTYRQLGFWGEHETYVVPGSGEAIALDAGRCDCGERIVILCQGWRAGIGNSNIWGCLDCNNYCDSGEHLTRIDDISICHVCDACSDCCDCPYCQGCENIVSETLACDLCRNCCDCFICQRCPSGYDHIPEDNFHCGDCECCEDHCDCVRCSYCGEIADTVCEEHSYCSYCCEDDDCSHREDETDMEGIRATLADVPTYVSDAASKVGPYTFGIELEHNGNGVSVCREIMRCVGLDAWYSKEDGSLHSSTGAEVVSPILRGEDGFAQMRTAMLALSANGGTVNRECGTHVHIGADDMDPEDIARLVRFYDRNVSLIDSLHPASRRNAFYCENWRASEVSTIDDYAKGGDKRKCADAQSGRYRKVNLHSLRWHGTIEFRQHAGTLNPVKLEAWVRFLFTLCDMARFSSADQTFSSVPEMLNAMRAYGLPDDAVAYLSKRATDLAAA